jgi:hypothetical protein
MYIVYCIFPRMLGGFLHICTCTCTIYCGLWPPDNTSCIFLTWYQSYRFFFARATRAPIQSHRRRRHRFLASRVLRLGLISASASALPSLSRPRLDLLSASFTGSVSCSLVPRLDLLLAGSRESSGLVLAGEPAPLLASFRPARPLVPGPPPGLAPIGCQTPGIGPARPDLAGSLLDFAGFAFAPPP